MGEAVLHEKIESLNRFAIEWKGDEAGLNSDGIVSELLQFDETDLYDESKRLGFETFEFRNIRIGLYLLRLSNIHLKQMNEKEEELNRVKAENGRLNAENERLIREKQERDARDKYLLTKEDTFHNRYGGGKKHPLKSKKSKKRKSKKSKKKKRKYTKRRR